MKIKKYTADSIKEALLLVKNDLGEDAIILKTSKSPKKTLLGLNEKEQFEVTAAIDAPLSNDLKKQSPSFNDIYEPSGKTKAMGQTKFDTTGNIGKKGDGNDFLKNVNKIVQEYTKKDITDKEPPPSQSKTDKPSYENINDNKLADLINDIKEIKTVVEKLSEIGFKENFNSAHENVKKIYNHLIERDFDESFIIRLIDKMVEKVSHSNIEDYNYIFKAVAKNIENKLTVCEYSRSKKPYIIVMIGPTGVGKTTTTAKLASINKLINDEKVGIISVDTYRIAAVEQLKTFANISSIPFLAAYNKEALKDCIERFRGFDYIYIDTAGRSPKNRKHIKEAEDMFSFVDIDHYHLLISSTTKLSDMVSIYENFSNFNINSVIFTKIDESNALGNIFNFNQITKIPIAYITNGQEVPDDIVKAEASSLTTLMLE